MKKLVLTILLSCLISVAVAANHLPTPKPTSTHLRLPPFSAIRVIGFVNLMIRGSRSQGRLGNTVIESRNPQWVNAIVRHHVLYLTALHAAKPSRKAPMIKVSMTRLNRLDVFGRASVHGKQINSDGLYLRADTTGNITLNGQILVDQIHADGPGHINLRWVTGHTLVIQGLSGRITLAGTVDRLRVRLRHHAILNARYLRAKHVLIETKNFATAQVLPLQSLRAFASDFSNVYYYKIPQSISRYTSRSGNVLLLKQE